MTFRATFPIRSAFPLALMTAAVLAACGGGGDDSADIDSLQRANPQTLRVSLEKIGGYATGVFGESAAEIPAFDAASKRLAASGPMPGVSARRSQEPNAWGVFTIMSPCAALLAVCAGIVGQTRCAA